MSERDARRPLSRRLMLALFAVAVTPMIGWVVVLEPGEPVRLELWGVLGLTVAMMGVVVVYLRRHLVDPLGQLADQARGLESEPWATPTEVNRSDEIGDLARALDRAVTDLESRAREALQSATDLSHELRTPLAAIRGAAEILSDGEVARVDRDRFVHNISQESARLERLVAGVLDLERHRQGRQIPRRLEPVDCENTLKHVAEVCRPLAARKQLHVRTACTVKMFQGDPDHIRRILFALVENAIQYAPTDSEVLLSAVCIDDRVRFSVADRGPGVAAEHRERVFERSVHRSGGHGTGLGLAVVQALARDAGGSTWVYPHPEGGSIFSVDLPARLP